MTTATDKRKANRAATRVQDAADAMLFALDRISDHVENYPNSKLAKCDTCMNALRSALAAARTGGSTNG